MPTVLGIGLTLDMANARQASAAAPPSFSGVLDAYTSNLGVAVGIKRLLSSWTGNLFRVRRSSDNAEQDIGYASDGTLDSTALLAFCGGGNGFIKTLYDQSGNGVNLTDSTAADQAKIVASGVVNSGATFAGGALKGGLESASLTDASFTDGTHCQVAINCNLTVTSSARIIDFGPDKLSCYPDFAGASYWDAPFPTARLTAATPGGLHGSDIVLSLERNAGTSNLRINGTVAITGSVSGTISTTSIFSLGSSTVAAFQITGIVRSMAIWKDCTNMVARAAALA